MSTYWDGLGVSEYVLASGIPNNNAFVYVLYVLCVVYVVYVGYYAITLST